MLVRANQVHGTGLAIVTLGQHALRVLNVVAHFQHAGGDVAHAHGLRAGAEAQQHKAIAQLVQQPGGLAVDLHRCIGAVGAGGHLAVKRAAVSRVQAGCGVRRGCGQAAAVDQRACKRLGARQFQHRIAQAQRGTAFRGDEVRGAGAVQQVVVSRIGALFVVGVQQGQGRVAVDHGFELPGQVVAVLHAGVGTACAEGGHLVRRVAHEDHAAMAEVVDAAARKLVHRHPLQLELGVRAQHGLDAGNDLFGLLFFSRVAVPAQLEVDAPDVVALFVQQHALVAVKRWVEPEPALGREVGLHDHVGNQEAVLEEVAGEVGTDHAAGVAVGAVGGNDPVGLQFEYAIGRFDGQRGHVVAGVRGLVQAQQLVLPAQVHQGGCVAHLHQLLFQIVLLQVDHGRQLVVAFGQQVELVGQLVVEEHLAHFPLDAPVGKALAHAQAVPDFKRALGVTHGPRADADGVVVVQHHACQAARRAIQRLRQADGPCADDDNGVALDLTRLLFGALGVRKLGVGVGLLHGRSPGVAVAWRAFGAWLTRAHAARQGA